MISVIQILFLVLAGIAMSIMWTLQFHFSTSVFKDFTGWDPAKTCNNKYKNGDKNQGTKFLFSTTLLVFLTDPFHLFQAIMLELIFLAMSLSTNITPHFYYDFLILRCSIGIPFQISFTLLKNDK